MRDELSPGETRLLRVVLLAGSVINLVFWTIHQRLGHGSADPLWQRVVVSAACLAIAGSTWGPPRVRALTGWGVLALAFGGTLWWIHRVASSGLAPEFAVGSLVQPAIVALVFRRPQVQLGYSVVVVTASAVEFAGIPAPAVPAPFLVLCLATILGIIHLQLRTRLRASDDLVDSQRLRRAMADQTTDALILVDARRRAAIECNGRARFLFEIGADAPLDRLADMATGADHAAIAGALAVGGTFRGRRAWRTPAGAEIYGELTVSPVRLGRRPGWLVRIADAGRVGSDSGGSPALRAASADAGALRAEELAMLRRMLLAGAVMVPAFWFVRRAAGMAEADPLWQRLVFSAACLTGAALTRGGPRARVASQWSMHAIAVAGTLWWIHRVAATGLRPDYAAGLLVAPAIAGMGFHRALHHLLFSVVAVLAAAAWLLPLPHPGIQPGFVLLCLATMLGLMHLLFRIRLGAYDDLLASEDLREALFERTSDALALVDPIRREVVECNGRARSLLGFVPGPATRNVASALLDVDELRTVDVVTAMKEIADRGAYRRERTYEAPDGRTFTGDLAILAVRTGHRQTWLVRVAERA